MRINRRTAPLALALLTTALALGCSREQPAPPAADSGTDASADLSVLGKVAGKVATKIRDKMATENITLDAKGGAAKAEITPQGDLHIDGKPVALDDAQRALLLDYRTQIAAIAGAGAEIGVQGADLATKAMKESLGAVMSGNDPGEVEKRIEAQADGIRAAALRLCDRMPAMLAAQRAAAAAIPAFAPYATMDESDIDDCRKDTAEAPLPTPPEPPQPPAAPQPPQAPAASG